MSVFKRLVQYRFECCDEFWVVTQFGKDWVEFEECRKNGQEDCHMCGRVELIDGEWVMTEQANLDDDLRGDGPAELVQFFHEHFHELKEQA